MDGPKRKLNLLPENKEDTPRGRFPEWLHRKLPKGGVIWKTHDILNKNHLSTVCEEARCPNLPECYSKKTATFLAMGSECTRACGFCQIDFSKTPKPLEEDEPSRLAQTVQTLGLKHVVITMVARDDLPDGGASHLVKIIREVRAGNPGATVEILTSDFEGNSHAYDLLIEEAPEIFNHNMETVRFLTPKVRHKATYDRSLSLLHYVKKKSKKKIFTKSGLMLGLGESETQVHETLRDLANAGIDIVTIGHYLQPSRLKLRVHSFIEPKTFEAYAAFGKSIGIPHIYAGPFVRSSYNAADLFNTIREKQ